VSGAIRHSKRGCLSTSKTKFGVWSEASGGRRPQRMMTGGEIGEEVVGERGSPSTISCALLLTYGWNLRSFSIISWTVDFSMAIFLPTARTLVRKSSVIWARTNLLCSGIRTARSGRVTCVAWNEIGNANKQRFDHKETHTLKSSSTYVQAKHQTALLFWDDDPEVWETPMIRVHPYPGTFGRKAQLLPDNADVFPQTLGASL